MKNTLWSINSLLLTVHQSVEMVERYHQTLINQIRKMKFIEWGLWTDDVEDAVSTMSSSVHGIMKYAPRELWVGDENKLQLAHQRLEKERTYRNAKRRIHPTHFYPGQLVLVWDEGPSITRFQSRWRGPYYLTEQISHTVWAANGREDEEDSKSYDFMLIRSSLSPLSEELSICWWHFIALQ